MKSKLLILLLVSGMLAVSGCGRGQENAGTTTQQAVKPMEMAKPAVPETTQPAMETAESTMQETAAPAETMEAGEQTMESAAETMETPKENMEDAATQADDTMKAMGEAAEKKVNEGVEAVKPALEQ